MESKWTMEKDSNRALPPGSVLNGKYFIQKSIGEGGFGITYAANDSFLNARVAIKEYYPVGMAFRSAGTDIQILPGMEEQFAQGLQRYVNEAKILSELFNLPGIVCVKDFFYENHTAYIVMEYIDGVSLKEYLKQNRDRLSAPQMLAVMEPILSSLSIVHRHGLLHRDISPDNIMISKEGDVKLIDFGAARNYQQNAEQSMTVVLKHGYAPMEQYSRNGQQDKYTDVYSICATMYRMLTGAVPVEAIDRLNGKQLLPIHKYRKVRVPRYIENAIMKGLSVSGRERQQSVEELYMELYKSRQERWQEKMAKVKRVFVGILCIAVVGLLVGMIYLLKHPGESGDNRQEYAVEEREEATSRFSTNRSENNTSKKETPKEAETQDEVEEAVSAEPTQEDTKSPLDDMESQNTYSISVVKQGVLYDYSHTKALGEILEMYYEDGVWQEQKDEYGNTYVNFIGLRDEDIYAFHFQVYEDDTFIISNIARNGENIADMNGYLEQIFGELNL